MKESPTWVQRRVLDVGYHYVLAGGEAITDLGKIFFELMVGKIKKGEKTPLSEYFGVLNGFGLAIEGLDSLKMLTGKNALYLSNHTENGPLRNGHWKLFATNYVVKEITEKEIRWTYGQDRSTGQELFREPVTKSVNAIPVREGTGIAGIREILKAFQSQDSVGLYPEGDGRKELIKGDPKAGGIIYHAAIKGIPIVAISAWFEKEKNVCHLNFALLDNTFIKSMGNVSSNRDDNRQRIVDYAMTAISQNMPSQLRGYYQLDDLLVNPAPTTLRSGH